MRLSLSYGLLLAAVVSQSNVVLARSLGALKDVEVLQETRDVMPIQLEDIGKRATNTIAATDCHVTAWASIAAAQTACATLTLDGIAVPSASGINLNKLKSGATVVFAGKTTFAYTPSVGYKMVQIAGDKLTIKGAPGSYFDGGGPSYWDGKGNSGSAKPGIFMKLTFTNSLMDGITIKNTPTHAVSIDGVTGSTFQNLVVDNSAGDAPNSLSGTLAAAHNTDGFDVANVENILMQNVKVYGQDDCVALSVSSNTVFKNFYCSGTHGLSIAGGGGGQNNITNVLFTDSQMTKGTIGLRIKTDSGAQGTVTGVTYSNIVLSSISSYGIDIQQDYGNTGTATNGVKVSGVTFSNITGSVSSSAMPLYIFCGSGSCSNFKFTGVKITGGKASTCNYPSSTCPSVS